MIGMFNFSDGNLRRVTYPDETGYYGTAVFIPVCPNCGRFVTANGTIVLEKNMLKKEPNAICRKCGAIEMPFEGFF